MSVGLDCRMDFDYNDDYADVVFAHTDLQLMIPRTLIDKFKTIESKEWDKLFIDMINKRVNQSPIELKEISSKDLDPEYAKLVNENWEDLI